MEPEAVAREQIQHPPFNVQYPPADGEERLRRGEECPVGHGEEELELS